MIRCKKSETPYLVFTTFAFDLMQRLADGEYKKAQKMFDEDHLDSFWVRVVELGVEEMETEYKMPSDQPDFEMRFYSPAMDLENDYSLEFSIPNTEMEMEIKIEFAKVKGGYRTILVSV